MKIRSLCFALSAFALCAPVVATAGMDQQMDKMFNQMSNTTKPGVYNNARRGVISSGGITIRNQTQPINLVSYAPAELSGGCGGIDATFGSLSWVSSAQIEQLMRNVASNAEGLLFQMALSEISEDLSNKINAFADKAISKVGQLKNSCQIATSAVSSFAQAVGDNTYATQLAQQSSVSDGSSQDAAAAANQQNPVQTEAQNNAGFKELVARNIMWDAITSQNVANAFGESGNGAKTLNEEIMTLTGTIVTCIPDQDPQCKSSGSDGLGVTVFKPTLHLSDLVYGGGGAAQRLQCNDSKSCMQLSMRPWVDSGFLKRVQDMIGTPTSNGYLGSIFNNAGTSPQLEAFISNSGAAGAEIMRVARATNADQAMAYAQSISQALAIHLAYHMLEEVLDNASRSVAGANGPETEQMMAMIREDRQRLDTDYAHMVKTTDLDTQMAGLADVIISTAPKQYSGLSNAGLK